MAGRRPLLIFLEDIHWADGPSLDALLELVRRRAALPLLITALARPSLFERRAAGNPFYMEDLVKMLIDDGVIVAEAERWRVDLNRLHQDRAPGTLTGVLQARLDRLAADERVTLQRASVVGRVFWDRAVRQLGDDPGRVQLTPLQNGN